MFKVKDASDYELEIMKVKNGLYQILDTDEDFGFTLEDPAAVSIDHFSDAWDCFGISQHCKIGNVEIEGQYIIAPNQDEIRKAFLKISYSAYDPDDV